MGFISSFPYLAGNWILSVRPLPTAAGRAALAAMRGAVTAVNTQKPGLSTGHAGGSRKHRVSGTAQHGRRESAPRGVLRLQMAEGSVSISCIC